MAQIREAIRKKYGEVSVSAEGEFKYITGKSGVIFLKYDRQIVDAVEADLLSSFCGVGNPFSLGKIEPGSAVLDIGCGAGFDLVVASKLAGPQGKIRGVDLTEEMVHRGQNNIEKMGLTNIEIQHVSSEKIPYDDETFDVVTSNGVINLSPCKLELFQEIFRVLRNGGRLQFSDVMLEKELPPNLADNLEAWTQ